MKKITKKQIPWNKGKKGLQIPWNKGLKGVLKAWNKGLPAPWLEGNKHAKGNKPNKTSFKKGQVPHNKEVYTSKESPAIHYWIKKKLGQPKYCEHCKKNDKKLYDWANKDHLYRKIVKDWMRLCRGCHMRYDYKFNNRKKVYGN